MAVRIQTALSEHPLATQAVGECAGALLEAGGTHPDLLLLSVTPPLAGVLEDILGATHALLQPGVQIGVTTDRIITAAREVHGTTALSMCALWLSRRATSELSEQEPQPPRHLLRGLRLSASADLENLAPGENISSELESLRDATGTLILLATPSIHLLNPLLERIAAIAPRLIVVGGSLGSSHFHGATQLCLHTEIYSSGIVAVVIPAEIPTCFSVSQAHLALGPALVATRVERNVIYEIENRGALEVVQELLKSVPAERRTAARDSLRIGLFAASSWSEQNSAEVVYRGVLGADKATGAIVVGQELTSGTTVQFAVPQAETATSELQAMSTELPTALATLVFSSRSRGADFYGLPNHEASIIADAVDPAAVWGISCLECLVPFESTSRVSESALGVLTFTHQ